MHIKDVAVVPPKKDRLVCIVFDELTGEVLSSMYCVKKPTREYQGFIFRAMLVMIVRDLTRQGIIDGENSELPSQSIAADIRALRGRDSSSEKSKLSDERLSR